jgi:putative NADH-flavin reductase
MAHILVIGASQGIGKAVCQAAVQKGHSVRAMSRSGRMPGNVGKNCQAFGGDALKVEDVARALDQVDVVVQALGVPASLDLILKPVTLFSEATRVLLPAMKKAGVTRLVAVTGFGAGDSRAAINIFQRLPFKLLLKNAYDDKSLQEKLIADSDLDWLIVRPGVLTNGPFSGKYRVLSKPGEWRNGIISRADVADFILKRIEANSLLREKAVIIRFLL